MGAYVTAIFFDEFLFMNPKVFAASIPTLLTGALVVLTSSMSPNSASAAMRIIKAKNDDGSDVVTQYNWTRACGDCRRAGTAATCKHFVAAPQHFHNYASHNRVSKMMAMLDGAFEREVLNQSDEPDLVPAFQSHWIDAMVQNHRQLQGHYGHLFITIDPSSGKGGNYYVVASMVFDADGRCTV